MAYSYEEIRCAALDILAKREKVNYDPSQYEHLKSGLAEVFARREGGLNLGNNPNNYRLDAADTEMFLEVFWDLFRQGIITLGLNDSNNKFPWFRVSHFGKKILENQSTYFFHDVSTYKI